MLSNAIRIFKPKVLRLSPAQFETKLNAFATITTTPRPTGKVFAYTVPFLKVDSSQDCTMDAALSGTSVHKIKSARLTGTLHQEIWILNTFSSCEERYVLAHEKRHARDNQNTVKKLHGMVSRDSRFPSSYYRDVVEAELKLNQEQVGALAGAIFLREGRRKTSSRDDHHKGDLARTMQLIKKHCNSHFTLGYQFLKRGASGPAVFKLQLILNAWLLSKLSFGDMLLPDGDFGPKTEAAVKLFQNRYCKPADGIVGPKTSKALLLN